MSTRKRELLYHGEKDGRVVELNRSAGRLILTTHNKETGSTSTVSIVDPWYTPKPRVPARPS